MRRKPVHIIAHPSFYRMLDAERQKISKELKTKYGLRKDLSMFSFTEYLSAKGDLIGGGRVRKKGRR